MTDNTDNLISLFGKMTRSRYFMTAMMASHRKTQLNDDLHSVRGKTRILFLLKDKDGLKNSEIVEILDIKPSSVSMQVQTLEEEGLVERHESENDKRVSLIYLTEKGKQEIENGTEKTDNATNNIFKDLTEQEKEDLSRILNKINERLTKLDKDKTNKFFDNFAGIHGEAMRHEMHHHMNRLKREYRSWWD
ncbi:hypothetical protein RD055328_11470 [Companilactobacillus sp. RD055328]|uniref:MarR family winged helix-turn-helix transcriptional regulator n=1 Tax=Companilactobacillus sp. RD055328 TaxID=2916634 RepID=UPI001FC7EA6E|nr:MarR family transcriptional regulator [Companilactobacillus sp. RD055328]GKQ43224.1 hypothetical protein RD055328_11470 [Companilactobacillus sp. RD055328]